MTIGCLLGVTPLLFRTAPAAAAAGGGTAGVVLSTSTLDTSIAAAAATAAAAAALGIGSIIIIRGRPRCAPYTAKKAALRFHKESAARGRGAKSGAGGSGQAAGVGAVARRWLPAGPRQPLLDVQCRQRPSRWPALAYSADSVRWPLTTAPRRTQSAGASARAVGNR